MSDFESGFTFGDAGGPEYFLGGADIGDALDEAPALYPKHTPIIFDGDLFTVAEEGGSDFTPNRKSDIRAMARMAHKRSGLYREPTYDAFEIRATMSLDQAFDRLYPYFRTRHVGGQKTLIGKLVKAYDSPQKMLKIFMTANAKLLKGEAGYTELGVPASLSMGPNLLPHSMLIQATLPKGRKPIMGSPNIQKKVFPMAAPFDVPRPPGGVDFCVGSNDACRSTCLLYSGNNPTADSQTMVKMARSTALVMEPEAWIRMWIASIEHHVSAAVRQDKVPYVRPNVLSDIPWELVCPTVFDMFPELIFYDYTKVAGRLDRPNYDLTFSFSGTNTKLTEYELESGRRVAVVFWLPGACLKKGSPKKLVKEYARYVGGVGPRPDCEMVEDYTFMGYPVITGDLHDFRPLDPAPSVIGLTYKIPKVKVKGTRKLQELREPPPAAKKFAMSPSRRGLTYAGGRHVDLPTRSKFLVPTFRDRRTGALIVAGTPDQLGASLVFRSAGSTVLEVT